MNIDLSTGAPASPERTRQLAATFAELARVMNHATMHHEALEYPSDVDRVIREIASAASRLPQFLGQLGTWLGREDAAGRVMATGTAYVYPDVAVRAAVLRLAAAAAIASDLQEALDSAASITSDLASAVQEDGSDD